MMKVLKLMMLAPLLFFCGLTQADMNSGLAEIQHAWAGNGIHTCKRRQ